MWLQPKEDQAGSLIEETKIMSHYHKEELKTVMPLYGVETYTVRIQIRTEEGATKWITVPADKIDQLKILVEGF